MSTLLLRLAAPLQAWGTDSKFEVRRTNREPSKSGVIGLLAAALGLRRDADLSKLSALRFGVRVDRNGEVIKDFHMAKAEKTIRQSHRYIRLDCGVGEQEGAVVQDLPISFNPMRREFGYRRAKEIWLRDDVNTEGSAEEHDAMAEL